MSTDYSFLGIKGLNGDKMVKLQNYGRTYVEYSVTLSNGANVTRSFRPMVDGRSPHAIQVPFDELYQLSQSPGGMQLIFDNLYTDDMEVRQAIGLPYDKDETPEITYSREDVSKIVREGSDDEIMDLVEFGLGSGLHYIAEWMKEDLLTIDSSSRRDLIGEMLHINPDALSDVTKWMAEDEEAGRLGFGEVKGLSVSKGTSSSTNRRRRAGKPIADGTAQPIAQKTTSRRRAVKK